MATTVYDVRVQLGLADRLTPGVRRQTSALEQLRRSAQGATSTLDRLARAAMFGFGIKTAFDLLVGYNAELDGLKQRLSTVIMLNQGGDWIRSWKMASDLTEKLREDARKSAGTTKDMVQFAAQIAQPVMAAGGSMADLRDFTRQAVVAATALGERAELAQLDITQALQGTLTLRDRFARALLAPTGLSTSQFNAKKASERFSILLKALNDPAIKAAAKQYETSFAGVTSTLKDNLQILAGNIGRPLFTAITREVITMNEWLEKNKTTVDDFAKKAASFLIDAFTAAKKAIALLVEHKDLLLTLAKAFLVTRGVSLLTAPIGWLGGLIGAFGQLSTAVRGAGTAAASFAAGLKALPAGIGAVAGAGFIGVKAGQAVQDAGERRAALVAQARGLHDPVGPIAAAAARASGIPEPVRRAQQLLDDARRLGIVDASGRISEGALIGVTSTLRRSDGADREAVRSALAEAQTFAAQIGVEEWKRQMRVAASEAGISMGEHVARQLFDAAKRFGEFAFNPLLRFLGAGGGNPIRSPKPPQVNVGKLVIEVSADDPDRFAMGIEGYFQRWMRSPTGDPGAFREGR